MPIPTQIQRILDFFANGKTADPKSYQPEDVANVMSNVEDILTAGLSAKHLADGAFRLLPFDGVDGSGLDPDLTCTLTGALEGDTVAAILDTADFSDKRAKFETVITAVTAIEQIALEDLSEKTYLALLIKE